MEHLNKAQAERRCEIAEAKLAVAEDLRFAISLLLGLVVYLKFDTFWGALIAFLLAVYWVPRPYNKECEAAHDELEKLTGTGKYYKPPSQIDLKD